LSASPDPRVTLFRLIWGFVLSQALYTVAKLGVADMMPRGEPLPVTEIAARVGADEDALYQSFLKAEGDYRLRETDLAGVEADLKTAQHELDTARGTLTELQAQLTGVETEMAALLNKVTAQRAVLTEAQKEFDGVLAALEKRLQAALPPPAAPAATPPAAAPPAPAPAAGPAPATPPAGGGSGG